MSETLFRHRVEYAMLMAFGRVASLLPAPLTYNGGLALAWVFSKALPLRREIVRNNLHIAFGEEMSQREENRLLTEAYKSLILLGLDALYLTFRKPSWAAARVKEAQGREHIDFLREEHGGRFLTISGHIGSWEILGAYGGMHDFGDPLAQPLHNTLMQKRLAGTRERYGLHIIWTGSPSRTIREILRRVNSGRAVNIMVDQDARTAGIFVPFFGRPASTLPLPAHLALRYDLPVLPVFCVRLGPLSNRVIFRPPIWPADIAGDTEQERVLNLTARLTAEVEDMVRLYPAQYFWFHRRWKTTPESRARYEATQERKRQRRREQREAVKSEPPPS